VLPVAEKSRLFLVLCLHRSGSSATAGVMHLLGIHMGDKLIQGTVHNPKGHFENIDYVKLNQEILQSVNGSWNRPPSHEKIIATGFPSIKLRNFIAKNMKPVWGLKDPRTLLTFEVWKPYLEEAADIIYVFVHRPFIASVRSLTHRNLYSMQYSEQILTPYMKNLNHYRQNCGIPTENIIDVYYEELIENPEPIVRIFNKKIGNPPDNQLHSVREFLDKKLKKF
jgi:hypothetical protein